MLIDYFSEKNTVTVYFPSHRMDGAILEGYLIELFDLLAAYLKPLEYGLSKGDLLDYISEQSKYSNNILEFLKYKAFIADSSYFKSLAEKYSQKQINSENFLFKKEFCIDEQYTAENLMESISFILKDYSFDNTFSKEGISTNA